MKKVLAIVLAIALAGCASAPKQEAVNIPVAVPCNVDTPVKPSYHFSPPYTSVFDGTRDLLGDRVLSNAYEQELEAALKSCK